MWLVGFLALFLTACSAAEPPTADVAANWNGTINVHGGDPNLPLLTLSLEQFGTDIEGVAALGPVSETSDIGLLAGDVAKNRVTFDFAILEMGNEVALYSLMGSVEGDVMRGDVTRRILHESSRGTFEVTRER